MTTVLLVDDQQLVRTGFRLILDLEPDMEIVGEASDGQECIRLVAETRPDVVLMDVRMPVLDGIQATRRLSEAGSESRVLILTTFDLDEYVYDALAAGASGFVLKDDPPEQLIAAIRTVAAGDALLSPAVTKRVIRQFTRIPRPEPPRRRARCRVLRWKACRTAFLSPASSSRSPMILTRTLLRCSSARSRRMKIFSKPRRSFTSPLGRDQFSEENANKVW